MKDETISKFIYAYPPPSFSYARYVDWFAEYISNMQKEIEKNPNSPYHQNKAGITNKTFAKFNKWREAIYDVNRAKENEQIQKAVAAPDYQDSQLQKTWMHEHPHIL